jgi:hypothetical protein
MQTNLSDAIEYDEREKPIHTCGAYFPLPPNL